MSRSSVGRPRRLALEGSVQDCSLVEAMKDGIEFVRRLHATPFSGVHIPLLDSSMFRRYGWREPSDPG